MSYRNSFAYVQRQIDRVLRNYRDFAKAYINDIVIFSTSLQKHLTHLRKIFDVLAFNNISIKYSKTLLEFVLINFLNQHVISLKFFTDEQKLHAIANLIFSKNVSQLKTYLELIE